jgi:hypothetical protein
MVDCDGVAMIILSEMGDCWNDVMLRRGEHGIWVKCPTLLLPILYYFYAKSGMLEITICLKRVIV